MKKYGYVNTDQESKANAEHSSSSRSGSISGKIFTSKLVFTQPSLIQRKLDEATHSSSENLDHNIRPEMEKFLAEDLSGIKVHNNAASHEASQMIQAKAYTTGNHIFLGREAGTMTQAERTSLLAHEVVHTVQQKSFSPFTVQAKSEVSAPDYRHEKEADTIADAFTQLRQGDYQSMIMPVRSQLPISSVTSPAIQRKVDTWGGEWDTTKYDLITPASAAGLRGVDIVLKFKPGSNVDAELIGLTQSVRHIKNKTPYFINNDAFYKGRSIEAADAINVNSATGETDEGTMIDRVKNYNNPIYPVDTKPSTSLADTSTSPGWGQHGYHYVDSTKTPRHQDALLKDGPLLNNAEKDSGQIFETTALATKGAQTGTYYGSVAWGWRTDSKGAFSKIPLAKVSDGVPSSTFLKAGERWNAGKSSTGADTIDLPLVDVKVTSGPVNLILPPPMLDIALPVGTRVQIIQDPIGIMVDGTIRVVDGPHTGITGSVTIADWPNIKDERQ